jgi:hypothetical protein
MNEFQQKVFDYLVDTEGSDHRRNALHDLIDRGFFAGNEDTNLDILGGYLEQNPRGFCHDGLERFKDALLEGIERFSPTKHLRVVFDLDLTGTCPFYDADVRGADAGVTLQLESALIRQLVGEFSHNGLTIAGVTWIDYDTNPSAPNERGGVLR